MSIEQVADRIAVQDVMQNYAAGVDERDMDRYRACFADDVEVLDFGPGPINGADAWVEYVVEALKQFGPTQHMLSPVYAEISGDVAECRTDVQALHFLAADPEKKLTLWATYETRMVRSGSGWKIQRHRLGTQGHSDRLIGPTESNTGEERWLKRQRWMVVQSRVRPWSELPHFGT